LDERPVSGSLRFAGSGCDNAVRVRFGLRQPGFVPPKQYPELTELQVGILKLISREETVNNLRYMRLVKRYLTPDRPGLAVSPADRQDALAIAQSIARLQHLITGIGPLFLPGLPAELSPAPALAHHQRTAYACVAMAAPDTLPETVLDVETRNRLTSSTGSEWYVAVNGFKGRMTEQRLGELLDAASRQP
jgi:hypothetical protein